MRIVLVGTKQAPKTSVARYLEDAYDYKIVGTMDVIEKFYRTIYFDGKWQRVPWEKTTKIYDAIYAIDPDMLIQYMEKKLKMTTRDVVIPDVRYVAELNRLRDLGFTVVRVTQIERDHKPHPGKALLNGGEGTVVIHEYYGKLPVDMGITFESRQNMKESVDYMVTKLTTD